MGRDTLDEALEELLSEALDIGADNWDSYLEPNRWPELKESLAYKKFKIILDKYK